jgi:hypothetical protein
VAEPEQQRDRLAHDDLPAVYVSPWGLLRRDLLAVLATVRLGAWQLWRRNRQGDLPRPAFWPGALVAWFWPALLGLLLSLLVAAGWGLRALQAPPPTDQVSSPAPALNETAAEPLAEEPPILEPPAEAPPAAEPPAEPPAQSPIPEPEPPQDPLAHQADPLLQAFAAEQGAELLQAARLQERDGDLELLLDQPLWQRLPATERLGLAEQWQLRAESLGYGRLWVLNGQGRPLARSARVGSGMILLAPLSPAHAP